MINILNLLGLNKTLYSDLFGEVKDYFIDNSMDDNRQFIKVKRGEYSYYFDEYGYYYPFMSYNNSSEKSKKVMLFPSESNRDWSSLIPFNEGDFLSFDGDKSQGFAWYVFNNSNNELKIINSDGNIKDLYFEIRTRDVSKFRKVDYDSSKFAEDLCAYNTILSQAIVRYILNYRSTEFCAKLSSNKIILSDGGRLSDEKCIALEDLDVENYFELNLV